MADYFDTSSALQALEGNISFNADGTIQAHYILQGFNYSPANGESWEQAQSAHALLFSKLSALPYIDYTLQGFKTHIPLSETLDRVRKGLPEDFTAQKYPLAAQRIAALRDAKDSGYLREFDRVYWLSVPIPNGVTTDTFLDRFVSRNPLDGLTPADFRTEEADIFRLIPDAFKPRRATPDQLYWAFDRMRFRGIKTVEFPAFEESSTRSPSGFPQIAVDKFANTEPILDQFVADYIDEDVKTIERAKQTYRANYRRARDAKVISVSSPSTQSKELPAGLTSFQSSVMLTGYPTQPSHSMMTYTSLVDQNIGVDADFTLRFTYDPTLLRKDTIRKFRSEHTYLANTTTSDDLDMAEYQDTGNEATAFHSNIRNPQAPIPMKVSTFFTFAHSDQTALTDALDVIIQRLEDNGYTAECIAGGQYTLLKQSVPGMGLAKLVGAYYQATTVADFAPTFPLRRTVAGDARGIPIAVNKENSFGQLIYYDIMHAPDRGNASILLTGAQGSGKSYTMKQLIGWVAGFHSAVHVYDPSPTGEYESYVRSLADIDPEVSVDVQNFSRPKYSMDPLKVYQDPEEAKRQFIKVVFPLLNIDPGSPVLGELSTLLDEAVRKTYKITSTRRLVEVIESRYSGKTGQEIDKLMSSIAGTLRFISGYPAGSSLVDPEGKEELPPISISTRVLVFRTKDLKPRHKNAQGRDIEADMGSALYLAAAEFTAWAFQQLNSQPCFTIGDEMSFLSNSPETLEKLVKEPTRQGRKYNKALIAGTQDATDIDENYNQIAKTFALRQERVENAEAALSHAGLPVNDYMINKMMNDTSPTDENGVVPGRNGEGWFVDGVHPPVRMQTLPSLVASQARAADTTASRMNRK